MGPQEITITGEDAGSSSLRTLDPSGDVIFRDGAGLDGSPGTEALRLCGDGAVRVRGIVEIDPHLIVRALLDWATRCLDAQHPPVSNMMPPTEPIHSETGSVSIAAWGERASILLNSDGSVYVNGALVGMNDKLRRNVRRVLERWRTGK